MAQWLSAYVKDQLRTDQGYGSAVKSTCSCKRSGFDSQYPRDRSQLLLTPVSGVLMLQAYTYMQEKHSYAEHKEILNYFLKSKFKFKGDSMFWASIGTFAYSRVHSPLPHTLKIIKINRSYKNLRKHVKNI